MKIREFDFFNRTSAPDAEVDAKIKIALYNGSLKASVVKQNVAILAISEEVVLATNPLSSERVIEFLKKFNDIIAGSDTNA